MAGIYVHMPFCASRCIYCAFYSTTRLDLRQRYVDAVSGEYRLRSKYTNERVRTIYIGGGTPSQLSVSQIGQLLQSLPSAEAEEVTLECNPDDVTADFAQSLASLPVNRVSMGAQTFSDERLRFLHRRHTSQQVRQAVDHLRRAGMKNISIDLMYGFPGETLPDWHADIDAALGLQVEHLSAYALQYEEGTPLYERMKTKCDKVDEETERAMYYDLKDRLEAAGYEHYELSNFAKRVGERSYRSLHNSSYWNQTPYLGLGAAAHSFDGHSRQWNVADIEAYIKGIESGDPLTEREELDADTQYNEMVMTRLRTRDGLPLAALTPRARSYCLKMARKYVDGGLLSLGSDTLRLTRRGLFVSDMVMSDLMLA